MKENWKLPNAPVWITLPQIIRREAETIEQLMRYTDGVIHIRKPEAPPQQIVALLGRLQEYGVDMSRLTLHYDESLARRYALGGAHLRPEVLLKKNDTGMRRSVSVHDWPQAIRCAESADYVFISPLFDSISKIGYSGRISPDEARQHLVSHRGQIVALGGISAKNIARVRRLGFDTAAVLGALWETTPEGIDMACTLKNMLCIDRKWRAAGGRLQFISDGNINIAESFLKAGGRWVQLRMKDTPHEMIIRQGQAMCSLCRRYGAIFIVNDTPQIALETGADGVHLGQSDMSPAQARQILGEGAIIGSTANTFEQIVSCSDGHTDYIGLGPFRFTTTKKNLSPVLGKEGYRSMVSQMREAGIDLPVVAIGGIEIEDLPELLATGVDGIALSGAIARSQDPAETTTVFLQGITRYEQGKQ